MANKTRSDVWNYFNKIDNTNASCTICKKVISYKSTITNLKGHLKRKHISVHFGLLKDPLSNQDANTIENTVQPQPGLSCSSDTATTSFSLTTETNNTISNCATNNTNSPQPPSKRQKTLGSYVGKKVTPDQKRKIDADLLDLFVLDFQPFSMVEDVGFKKFVKWIPGYELPSRKTISSVMIPALYHKQASLIKDKVNIEAPTVCITTDVWTSKNTESFMATTAHYITNEFKFQTVLLKCSYLSGHHTADNLASELKEVLVEWNLMNRVNFAVSDNASAIVKAIEEILKLKHYGCYAHKLNLIVQNALEPIEATISKVKKIVTHFKRSVTATEKLIKYQTDQGSPTPRKLKQEVPTRWNSTFHMLERFVELEEAVKSTIALIDKNLPVLSREEWQECKDLCIMLKPFDEMTELVSGEKYMTGSSVIVVTRCLTNVCKKIKENEVYCNFSNLVKEVLSRLEKGVSERFRNVEHSTTFALCTFLDPRYKTGVFSDDAALKKIKANVKDMVAELIRQNSRNTTAIAVPEPTDSESMPSTSSSSSFFRAWDIFKEIVSDTRTETHSNPLARAIKEVDTYLADDVLPLKDENQKLTCQLEWWIKHQHVYPNLATLFKTKCNIIATSVPCERLFSKSGQLISDRRSALTTSKVEMLMFLNANKPHFVNS